VEFSPETLEDQRFPDQDIRDGRDWPPVFRRIPKPRSDGTACDWTAWRWWCAGIRRLKC